MIRPHDARGRWDHGAEEMGPGWALALIAGMLVLSPVILGIAAYEWIMKRRRGVAPSPFIPEHPDSAAAWAKTMERGRQIQDKEERDGR